MLSLGVSGDLNERWAGQLMARVSNSCRFWGRKKSGASPETPVTEVMAELMAGGLGDR